MKYYIAYTTFGGFGDRAYYYYFSYEGSTSIFLLKCGDNIRNYHIYHTTIPRKRLSLNCCNDRYLYYMETYTKPIESFRDFIKRVKETCAYGEEIILSYEG